MPINPILFQIGPVTIRYYGILLALAFIVGYFVAVKIGKERGINKDQLQELLLYLIVGILLGARIFHVVFYNFTYFAQNPLEILFIWRGGIASHGGIIGGMIAMWLFAKKHKFHFYDIADLIVIPAVLGGVFIRIGNFMNGELVGRITNAPWAMEFNGFEGKRHPSQLYESFKNLVIFLVLYNMRKIKNLSKGILFWSFVAIFSLFRFIVEFFKEFQILDPKYLLTMGQYLSIPFFIVAVIFIIKILKENKR